MVKDALGDSDEEGGSKEGEDKDKDGDAALPALSDSDDDAPKKDDGQVIWLSQGTREESSVQFFHLWLYLIKEKMNFSLLLSEISFVALI